MRAVSILSLLVIVPSVALGQDIDGDGVTDASDAYRCDPAAAGVAFAPSEGEHGMLLFEDLWPAGGDLDFNDVALGYHYRLTLDAQGRAVSMRATYNVRAMGGQLLQGFGLHLPVPREAVASVRRAIAVPGPEGSWVEAATSVALTPSSADAELTVAIMNDMRELAPGHAAPLNARPDLPRVVTAPITVDVVFATPQPLTLARAPFDVFIFRTTEPSHEIHLPDYAGTAAMDTALFRTGNDASGNGHWFKDRDGLPAAITLPSSADYPREATEISALYPRIVDFARTAGVEAADFYLTPNASAAYADAAGLSAPDLSHVRRTTPAPFCFAPQIEAPLATLVTGAETPIDGWAGAISIAVSGAGSPAISVNGGAWGAGASNVRAPATVRLRLTSSPAANVRLDADVLAGATAARWSVTTLAAPLGQPANPGTSCRDIRLAGATSTGLYWLRSGTGQAYQAYCDMTADGGGWTAIFAGRNGTPNVFDGFERTATTCTDISTRCVRRPPAGLDSTRVELAIACNSSMVAFPMTTQMWRFLSQGTRQGWISFTGARAIAGTAGTMPNTMYTGSSGDDAFIFALNQGSGGSTFASTYPQSASYNYCNGSSNTSATVRLFYRERAPVPTRNEATAARESCRAILDRGESTGSGLYWLRQGTAPAFTAHCDMTLDGGGWTTFFAGQNGSMNVFDRFDAGLYQGVCTDPSSRCMRRVPGTLIAGQTQVAARIGDIAVRFPLTTGLHRYFSQGIQAEWQPIAAESIGGGNILVRPNYLWTGTGGAGNAGFILATQNAPSLTFASSYGANATWDYGNLAYDTGSPLVLMYREGDPPVDPAARGTSCRDVLVRGNSTGDGIYRLQQPGRSAYDAYCNMTADGGGWTAVFSGTNGTPNVFDGFDDLTRPAATCTDVASRCVRRPPPSISSVRTELMIECGNARVAFPMTTPLYNNLALGQSVGWTPFTGARSVGTTVASVLPDTFYGGTGADRGFIFARSQGTGGSTFASTYPGSASYNYCNGSSNSSSRVRLYYREQAIPASQNAETAARTSCRAILDAGESRGSGSYWIRPDSSAPAILAHCDMTLDGGGWTTIFAGQNGSMNVFDRFDAGGYQGVCTDPGSRCVRRAPASIPASTEVAIQLGSLAYRFPLTTALRAYFTAGTQAGWQPIAAESIGAGSVVVRPTGLWTGDGTNYGFIAATANDPAYTFASSYNAAASWDYGNRAYDVSTQLRVMYREGPPPTDPLARGTSCLDVLSRGLSTGSGVYRLQQPGRSAYDAYCDMTSDGGGWTAMFSGTNGTPNVFDGFDDRAQPAATCTDVSSRCVRRPPPSINGTRTEVAVACGNAMVAMPMTAPLYRHFALGESIGWQNVTQGRSIGTTVASIIPDTYYGGTGGDRGFIWARAQTTGGSTFASTYPNNAAYNYCNGSSNSSSRVRVFYREAPVTGPLNTTQSAPASCRALLDSGVRTSGNYWIRPPASAAPVIAYCDMTLDGGGWTTILAGQNGAVNVFDRFDAGHHQGVCTDPATRCVRRAPSALVPGSTDIAVTAGPYAIRFPLTPALHGYFTAGTQAGWAPITAQSIGDGAIAVRPDAIYTGTGGGMPGFIVSINGNPAYTFASSFDGNASWDFANRAYDVSSAIRVMYREGTPPFDPAAEGTSCRDILTRGAAVRGSGVYRLQQSGSSSYLAYCDMTSGGGGWTAMFSGTNGTPNVFDGFDDIARPASTCTDVSSRCVRRPPTSIAVGVTEIAVACGNAMVRFPLTAEVRAMLLDGARSGWVSISGAQSIGTTATSLLPDTFFTGAGGDQSFIVARASGTGGNTFASTYPGSASFNYCNGSSNTSSRVRLYYR